MKNLSLFFLLLLALNETANAGPKAKPVKLTSEELTEMAYGQEAKESWEDYQHAVENLDLALKLQPKNVRARALLASALLRNIHRVRLDFETSDLLRETFINLPGPGKVPLEHVVAYSEYLRFVQRYDECESLLDGVLKNQSSPELFFQRAALAFQRSDLAASRSFLEKASPEMNPRYMALFVKSQEPEVRAEALARALSVFPSYSPLLLLKAKDLSREGKLAEALRMVSPVGFANSLSFEEGMAHELLWAELNLKNHFPEAALQSAKSYDGNDFLDIRIRAEAELATAKNSRHASKILEGWKQEKAGQLSAAINFYVEAAELDRTDPLPFQRMAEIYKNFSYPERDLKISLQRQWQAWETPAAPASTAAAILDDFIMKKDIAGANKFLAKALARRPQFEYAFPYEAAQIDLLRGETSEAGEKINSGLVNFLVEHFRPELFTLSGDFHAKRGYLDRAEFYYSLALMMNPQDPKAMLGLALARIHVNGTDASLSLLSENLKKFPDSAALLTIRAVIHLQGGDQHSGKTDMLSAIRLNPRNAEAFRLLGMLTKKEGDAFGQDYASRRHSYRYALASYEMYSKLNPEDPEGYMLTANLYFNIRDLAAAAKNFNKVLELAPNYPVVRLRLAQIARNGGDIKTASRLLGEEITINWRNDAAWVEAGNMAMAKKDFGDASAAFESAISVNEQNPDAHFGLGVIHHLNANYPKALGEFEKTRGIDLGKADVYWQEGLIYQKLKKWELAADAYRSYGSFVNEPNARAKAKERAHFCEAQIRNPSSVGRRLASASETPAPAPESLFDASQRVGVRLLMLGMEIPLGISPVHISPNHQFVSRSVQFRLPDGFQCFKENGVSLCQSANISEKHNAVIVVMERAAEASLDDNLQFQLQLEKPRNYQSLSGESVESVPLFVKMNSSFGRPWVEAMHQNSEFPDFVTRYFVTKTPLGKAAFVAFSVRKDRYGEYFPGIEALADSLKVPEDFGNENFFPSKSNVGENIGELSRSEFEARLQVKPDVLEARYQALLGHFQVRNFSAMAEDAAFLRGQTEEYKDLSVMRRAARTGLLEQEASSSAARQEVLKRSWKEELVTLEKQGVALAKMSQEEAKVELKNVESEIYRIDPESRIPASWQKK